jgi:hypothetical protein
MSDRFLIVAEPGGDVSISDDLAGALPTVGATPYRIVPGAGPTSGAYELLDKPFGDDSAVRILVRGSADERRRQELEELLSVGRYRAARWPGLVSKGWTDERGVVTAAGERALNGERPRGQQRRSSDEQ